ncbi:glycosyltransferase [Mycobacterium sp. CVI_P3]|uniref:Glycosyltransferase n=1 Tax=Mycobacterium pinniadriaticum TaxID=2994102 RepID=A0ABT3SHI5_9MYCO|nr:glycosyltransferase [Mycobacterium pinniadriaticum]MCX2932569.1 glycosyltransferase [Mycobacterium pinniadriaticum]MCX2938987.1 glycosyltransferase [Mycobacterium pinniadriaticum]
MKFAIAVHGTRGDVEPCAAVALELDRRGHNVSMAVPPNLVGFVQACGIARALPYGVDSQQQLEASIFRKSWGIRNPRGEWRELADYLSQGWAEMNTALVALARDADLILTGTTYQEVAANVAEYLDTPLAALHYFPFRANSVMFPRVPGWLARAIWPMAESVYWRLMKQAETAQRHELGLPRTRKRAIRRIVESGAVEIQAYDPMFFEGLAQEWAGRRPLIGSLTLQLDTDTDAETESWIGQGAPPIYFGFGSMPIGCPRAAVAMITEVCADLGERALICSGVWDVPDTSSQHVRIVRNVNHAAVFPKCRAVVHHGGAGTTAAGLRAGAPTFILWISAEQPLWAKQVTKLGVGTSERFSIATADSIRAGLQTVLAPRYRRRAARIAEEMTTPQDSVTAAADLLETAARDRRAAARRPIRRLEPEMSPPGFHIGSRDIPTDRAQQPALRFNSVHPIDRRVHVAE